MTNAGATLRAEPRSESGKGAARQLRRSGGLPAVVYGGGEGSLPLALDRHEFERLMARIHAATTVISLEVEGSEPRQVLIREIQRHPFRSDFLHVDFLAVTAGQKITVDVPVHLVGDAPGVEMGGIIQQIRHVVEVECIPSEIPSEIRVDISELQIGDSIHIGDLDVGTIVILDDADLTLCTCVQPTVITEEEEEEAEEIAEGMEGPEAEGGEAEEPSEDEEE